MLSLCLDTSYKHLVIAIYKADSLIDNVEIESERKQSEMLFPEIEAIFKKNHLTINNINNIVVTKGPGSYTGVRIAMTFAKVMAAIRNINIYTISTLELYQIADVVLLDAKSDKVFIKEKEEKIISVSEAKQFCSNKTVCGDTYLINRDSEKIIIAHEFINKKHLWHKEENVDAIVPHYLKEAI